MSLSLICNSDGANQLDRVVLEIGGKNRVLFIKLRWHKKSEKWLMSIFDEDNTPIIRNVPLVTSFDYPSSNLLNQYEYMDIGSAAALPTTESPETQIPGRENFGVLRDWCLAWGDPQ